jgi:hypothetical protein
VVISDSIGSPGFARDHLGFRSHSIGSPGIPGDHLGISHSLGSPGYAGDHLGFPSASWLSPGLAVTLGFSRTTRFTPVVLWFSRSTALGFLDLLLSVILSRRRQHSLLISLGFFSQTRWWRLGIIFPFFFFLSKTAISLTEFPSCYCFVTIGYFVSHTNSTFSLGP